MLNNDVKLDFDDVLIVPQRTKTASRKQIDIEREFKFYHSPRVWKGTPIMVANMYATGSFAMARELNKYNIVTCLHKHHDIQKIIDFYELPDFDESYTRRFMYAYLDHAWVSIGIKEKDLELLETLYDSLGVELNICIDVANGYTQDFVDFCKEVRDGFPESIIMAGNVCTPNMVEELILNGGVDIVKVGIGPGSVCTTRLVTGVGYPQLSAIMECAHAAHGLNSGDGRLGLICADGGCVHPGDVCKALCANADFVMLGGMLAGTNECDGDWECNSGVKSFLKFYGMSSYEAQKNHNGGVKDYRSSEGRVVRVPAKGPVSGVIQEITGGIRSCCAYIGADRIKYMGRCADFIRVNNTHNRSMT